MSIPFIHLDRASRVSLAEQIAQQVVESIRSGQLKAGASLPTVRSLSRRLQVSAETVQKAYRILQEEDWITSRTRHGTVVNPRLSPHVPLISPKREQNRFQLLARIKEAARLPGMFPLSGISLPPEEEIARILKQVASRAVEASWQVESHDPFGLSALRSKIQGLLAGRGFWTEVETICMVNGSQQAISLVAEQLLSPESAIGVPDMGYLPVLEAFRDKGARLVPIRHDHTGIDIAHLRAMCEAHPLRALYVMPHGQYPTGSSWSESKKRQVLQLARQFQLTIIEDEYYGELYYTPRPPLPLACLAQEEPGIEVIYVSSFSTILHPNVRLGYLVVPSVHIERFRRGKYLSDTVTSVIGQQLVLQVWEELELAHYLERRRGQLRQARDELLASLRRWLPPAYKVVPPEMGVAVWVYAPATFCGLTFFERCLQEQVFVMPDQAFAVVKPVRGFQVRFGHIPHAMLEEGVKRVGRILAGMGVK
ncbi:PLP-dependent aminotransferase family protein [Laceyella putida]|uniref:PLP-dependent aminotransferase family protein n=1 Tax=Laceyella putida TaxID=110101 RepID=A0ABW2RLV0_9BACL